MTRAETSRSLRRRTRPKVLMSLRSNTPLVPALVEMAREWNWDLIDYDLYGKVPQGIGLSGALLDALPDSPMVAELRVIGCPVVRLGLLPHPGDGECPAVLPDTEKAGVFAAEHFWQRGFRDVAVVGWNPLSSAGRSYAMFSAFMEQMQRYSATVHWYSFVQQFVPDETPGERFERRQRELGAWLKKLPKPAGVFTFNDHMAAQICVVCHNMGISVPEQVAVLGVGNGTWCERSPVKLSSVAWDHTSQVRRGGHLLRRMLQGKALMVSSPVMIPPAGLIQRRSTDVLALKDLEVAKALVFMWEHSAADISVDDVAKEVELSARQLARRFKRSLGRTVNQEIVRYRLSEVKRHLRLSHDSVADIALQTGFRSARYLHYAFLKAEGITPTQFRHGDHAKNTPI